MGGQDCQWLTTLKKERVPVLESNVGGMSATACGYHPPRGMMEVRLRCSCDNTCTSIMPRATTVDVSKTRQRRTDLLPCGRTCCMPLVFRHDAWCCVTSSDQ
jgi:hypothetical protein